MLPLFVGKGRPLLKILWGAQFVSEVKNGYSRLKEAQDSCAGGLQGWIERIFDQVEPLTTYFLFVLNIRLENHT